MEVIIQVICFLAGFCLYDFTGSMPISVGILLTASLLLWLRKYHNTAALSYGLFGLIASVHYVSGDYLSLTIIGLGLTFLPKKSISSYNIKQCCLISTAIIVIGITSNYGALTIAGAISLLITVGWKSLTRYTAPIKLALVVVYGILILPNPIPRKGASVYIEHGKWAMDSGDYGQSDGQLNLKNETTYSYTWMIRLISQRKDSVESLSDTDATAWLVTPTLPFTDDEKNHLLKWVKNGGRLIVIADHTDYLGHARCLNDLTSESGLQIQYGTFMPELHREETSTTWSGVSILTKTPTIAIGRGIIPFATAYGYFEVPDYSKPGFFGPCTPSVDDKYGRHLTGGTVREGLGAISFWGDSTLFSNFSIFQPDSIELLSKIDSYTYCIAANVCYFTLFTITLIGFPTISAIFSLILAVLAVISCQSPKSILSKFDNIAWSGDRSLVDDKSNPKLSFSTVFSLSSSSGKIPRWTDSTNEDGGIWVSASAPPSNKWKWLSPSQGYKFKNDDKTNIWGPIVSYVNPDGVYVSEVAKNENQKIEAGGLWTNEGIGSWWFGMGTSPARIDKIKSFNRWIVSGVVDWREPTVAKSFGPAIKCTIVLDGGKEKKLSLPRIDAKAGDYVYLGAGVSGLMTNLDGKLVITGSRDKDFYGYTNSAKQHNWVLFYDEDMPSPLIKK